MRKLPLIITGAVTALLASALLLGGGGLLWLANEKDDDGYLTTGNHAFASHGAALATENLDLDLDGAEFLVDDDDEYGGVRLRVKPQADEAVFVGIAPTKDVDAYLRGVSHSTVTDVDHSPFSADYRHHGGKRRAARPADEPIWAASAQGRGEQTVKWDVEDGDWTVVVMNADGSPGVWADIDVGARIPYLTAAAWTALGGGGLLLAGAIALLVAGGRRPRPHPGAPVPAPAAG
jgi:hypothetical protein